MNSQSADVAGSPGPRSLRPRLLVSVRDPEEVTEALNGGADWIDLKEPLAGPLGAVAPELAKRLVDCVAGMKPVSAALGELTAWSDSPARRLLDLRGIKAVKLGLAGCAIQSDWQSTWRSAAETVREAEKQLVTVAYADWKQIAAPPPQEVIACGKASRSRFLLVDTYSKQAGSVLAHLTLGELEGILRFASSASMQTVVAGGLSRESLSQLPWGNIDLVAVRGGVCSGDRTGRIDRRRVADFRSALEARWPTCGFCLVKGHPVSKTD